MPKIQLNDLAPSGADLFSDSESYLTDLTEEEVSTQVGGASPVIASIVASAYLSALIFSAAQSNPKSPHRSHA